MKPMLSDWPPALIEAVVSEAAHGTGARVWDEWKERAIVAGVDEALATLGRALMREAIVRNWRDDDARAQCGLYDEGEAMIELARRDPELAERSWSALLENDGRIEGA
jgi:hypothetical protein